MNPYTQDMPCPGGCGQTISYNKKYDDWTHSNLHDASCPFHSVEPVPHNAIMNFNWGKWKFNEKGEIEHLPEPEPEPEPEPKLADIISFEQYKNTGEIKYLKK